VGGSILKLMHCKLTVEIEVALSNLTIGQFKLFWYFMSLSFFY